MTTPFGPTTRSITRSRSRSAQRTTDRTSPDPQAHAARDDQAPRANGLLNLLSPPPIITRRGNPEGTSAAQDAFERESDQPVGGTTHANLRSPSPSFSTNSRDEHERQAEQFLRDPVQGQSSADDLWDDQALLPFTLQPDSFGSAAHTSTETPRAPKQVPRHHQIPIILETTPGAGERANNADGNHN